MKTTDAPIIEKGIPIPNTKPVGNRWGRGAKWVALIGSMEVGDSVLVENVKLSSIYTTCRRKGWKIRVQIQEDWNYRRVWRLK